MIYLKYNYDTNDESIIFYDIDSKDTYTCLNKTSFNETLIGNATVINNTPYLISKNSTGTHFFNLITNETEAVYGTEFDIKFVNNTTIISKYIEKNIWGKKREMVTIHKYPSKKVILQERGEYIGAVTSNSETTYIFLK